VSEVLFIQDIGLVTSFVLTTQLLVNKFSFRLKVQILLQPGTSHRDQQSVKNNLDMTSYHIRVINFDMI
jgi:hypothetical protein